LRNGYKKEQSMIYSTTYNQDLADIEQKSELRKIVSLSPVKLNTSVKFKEPSHYMLCSHQCLYKIHKYIAQVLKSNAVHRATD